MTSRITLIAFFCLLGLKIFAQQPSETYLRSMNSLLPGSPQSAQMMKYEDYPVSLFTGTPEITLPIYTCQGKGISVPISISYHAGGGVKVDELPTEVGLGFSLISGGQITRDMRGGPDEGGAGTSGFIGKPYPMATYVDDFNCCVGSYTNQQLWVNAMNGQTDLEPDIFYFSFGGYSGKFIWSDSLNQFVCITENAHLNISLNPNAVFTIVTDDGNTYVFGNKESTASSIINKGTAGGTTSNNPYNTTAWKLSKIINADATDSVIFNYVTEHYSYYGGGSCINYSPGPTGGAFRYPLVSFSNNLIDGQAHLSNISGTNFSVDFIDEPSDRLDVIGDRALSQIVIKNGNLETQNIFVLHHSYFSRNNALGPVPMTGNYVTKSLRLDSISEYGNSLSNSNPLRHAFTYNLQASLPGRLSFQQDWWGYPNSNTYDQSLVPPLTTFDNVTHPGADRTPDLDRVSAGILTGIRLPTGGTVTYEYEPNTTAIAVEYSKPDQSLIIPVLQDCSEWPLGSSAFFHDTIVNFTINEPLNALNNYQGGVVADVAIWPQAATGTTYIDSYMPSWTIHKMSEVNGATPYPEFDQTLQSYGLTGIHMPNGIYQARMWVNYYNQHLPPLQPLGPTGVPYDDGSPQVRTAGMTISYNITNAGQMNYSLAGVRVKKITTTDQYSTVTNTRTFLYHNPVNDSSYGAFIGSARNSFTETSQDGQWIVMQGSYNLPGMGNNASNVVYPKVIEDVSVNGTTYRTEHYFSRGVSVYPSYPTNFPFVPNEDLECARGNEYKTNWDKQFGSSFTIAKTKIQVFDSAPHLYANPAGQFHFRLTGIRATAASYDQALVITNGYAPTIVAPYQINVNDRLYLASDSTITYDLVNPYNGVKEWHDYTYGDYNHKPIIIRSGNSDGTVNIQKNYYASDQPEANTELNSEPKTQLIAANRIDEPLGTKQYKGTNLLSQQYTYVRFDNNSNRLIIDSVRQSLFSNPLDAEIKVLEYDEFADPLTIALRGGKYRKYFWRKDKGLPLATCITANKDDYFYFTSFEYPGDNGGTSFGNIFSGNLAFSLGINSPFQISTPPLNNSDLYFWAANGSIPINVNGSAPTTTGKTRSFNGNWVQYKYHLSGGTTSVRIGVSSFQSVFSIDDVVIIPTASQFQGVVYDASNRVVSMVNDQIETEFYEYDPYGRLTVVRDEQGNIKKSSTYQYQAAQ